MENIPQVANLKNYSDMDHITTVFYQARDIINSCWSHVVVKTLISCLVSIAAFMVGEENYNLIFFLLVIIAIDLITGMFASVSQGQPIESRKAFKTATKTIVYLLFFSAAYLTQKIVPFTEFVQIGVLSFLAVTEFFSVMENMSKMGYSLPQKLLNQIKEKTGVDPQKKTKKIFGSGGKKEE